MFLFIDTYSIIGAEAFADRMDFAVEEIANAPKAVGSDHIYLPGEMEWGRHDKAQRDGLALPKDVEDNARTLAHHANSRGRSCPWRTNWVSHRPVLIHPRGLYFFATGAG